MNTKKDDLKAKVDEIKHRVAFLLEELEYPPESAQPGLEEWQKKTLIHIEELKKEEDKLWKELHELGVYAPDDTLPLEYLLEKIADDDEFLSKLLTASYHKEEFGEDADKLLERLKKIAEKEEKEFFRLLQNGQLQSKLEAIDGEKIAQMLMGTTKKPHAIGFLFETLAENSSEPVRLKAGQILFPENWKPPAGVDLPQVDVLIEPLKEGLVSPAQPVRKSCMWVIFRLAGDKAFELFAYPLLNINPEIRFDMAVTLGFIRNRKAGPSLIKALQNEQVAKVKSAVLWALGYIKDPRALEALTECLDDENPEAGGYAAWALGEMGGAEAKKALAAAMNDEKKEKEVRDWAARALLKFGLGRQALDEEDAEREASLSDEQATTTCKCGHKNPAENKWCDQCGREL